MNQEITLNDYQSIGTMETALSEHADEAFFELTPEGQKIAEKIFKCLTETDGENREIRRATTIGKLCAIAEADFAEVAAVIETFRKEGRTFLMPPPEVPLNENSLIDISHESLIRKWERLKKWVEEEGQSSRTYRRLAEDALLYQQNKMGFWSAPELKDALEWRENFKPNETWAELYKETGERQFKASFADSMRYLDESATKREEEIAEDARQQNALRKYARNLRWTVIGLVFFSFLTIGVAAFALYQMNEAVQVKNALAKEKKLSDDLNEKLALEAEQLKIARNDKEKAFDTLKVQKDQLETKEKELSISLDKQKEATEEAKEEKERADKEAEQAKLSETAKQKALEEQKRLAAEAENKRVAAEIAQKRAETLLAEVKANAAREETNRSGLVFLEQGEFARALPEFRKLLARYEDESEPMSKESRNDGKWWAFHNIGIVNSKLPNNSSDRFTDAECSYKKALNVLQDKLAGLNLPAEKLDVSNCPPKQTENAVQSAARDSKPIDEINRSQITTLRRLAQFYREEAENSTNEEESAKLNTLAVANYEKLLKILPQEIYYEKQPTYPADVYVELADTLANLNGLENFGKIRSFYRDAAHTYSVKREFVKEVAVRKKLTEFLINQSMKRDVANVVEEIIRIQEDKSRMNLPPIDVEVADSYRRLARARRLNGSADANSYEKLANLISELDFEINKPDGFKVNDFEALANAYMKVGKCERAKEVFSYGIEQNKFNVNFAQYILSRAGQFYNKTLRDKNGAKNYFDNFYKVFKEYPKNIYTSEYITDYEMAGDFYLAQSDYLKAKELYEYALRIIAEVKELMPPEGKGDTIIRRNFAKFRYIEIITKIAKIYEAENRLEDAEAKYSEADKLIAESGLGLPIVKYLFTLADFYQRAKKEERAKELYKKAENILRSYPPFYDERLVLNVRLQKGLGYINRNDIKVAAEYYSTALKELREIKPYFGTSKIQLQNDYPPYTKNHHLTSEFYTDEAEILESLASLSETANAATLKAEAQKARELAKEATAQEEKPSCRQ
jgi:tetratricopeptide (TPR) repeat protein